MKDTERLALLGVTAGLIAAIMLSRKPTVPPAIQVGSLSVQFS